jgi:hypothetical protein
MDDKSCHCAIESLSPSCEGVIIGILEDVAVRVCGVYLLLSQYTGCAVDGKINKVYCERAVHFLWWRVSFDC